MNATKMALLGLYCVFAWSATAHALILTTGQTVAYQFNTLSLWGTSTFWGPGPIAPHGELFWNATSLASGTQLEVKMFENSANDTPLYAHIWTPSPWTNFTNLGGGITLSSPSFDNVWQDLQGAFSMTVLSGSASISDAEITSYIPFDYMHARVYRETLSSFPEPTSIPEPSSGALLGVAAMCMFVCRILENKRTNRGKRPSVFSLTGAA
jgi:hypothetical protein